MAESFGEKQIIRYISMIIDSSLNIVRSGLDTAKTGFDLFDSAMGIHEMKKGLNGDPVLISGFNITKGNGEEIDITKRVQNELRRRGIPFREVSSMNGDYVIVVGSKDVPALQDILNSMKDVSRDVLPAEGGPSVDKAFNEYNKWAGNQPYKGFLSVSPEIEDEMRAAFNERGIDFNQMFSGGVAVFNFDEKRMAEVNEIHNKIVSEHLPGGIIDRSMLNDESRNPLTNEISVLEIPNLSKDQAQLMINNSKALGVHIALKQTGGDRFTVSYCSKDQDAINVCRAATAISLAGEAGHAFRKSMAYQRMNTEKIVEKCALEDMSEPLYVVDGKNPDIHVTHSMIKAGDQSLSKDDPNVKAKERAERNVQFMLRQMKDMDEPVYLNEEQYKKYCEMNTKAEKMQFLHDVDKEHGRPSLSKEEYVALKELEEKHSLYEKKISESSVPQGKVTYSYTNDEMRMADFRECEKENWEMEHDKEELAKSGTIENATVYNDAVAQYKGLAAEKPVFEMPEEAKALQEAILEGKPLDEFGFGDHENIKDQFELSTDTELDDIRDYNDYIAEDMEDDANLEGNPYMNDEAEGLDRD